MMRFTEDHICSGTVTCTVDTKDDGAESGKETPEETTSLLDHLPLIHIDFGDELRFRSQENQACCSRNVMRKQRHWEKIVAAKKSKRRQEKETRKAKQCEDAGTGADRQQHSKKFLKALTKERLLAAKVSGSRLCIDLSMTDHMTKKEISRLAAQIRRLYGSNKKATKPFWLYLTGFVEDSLLHHECLRMNDGFDRYLVESTEDSFLDLFPLEAIIYLTPDSDHVLEDLDPTKVYVLGGLVDESVRKGPPYMAQLLSIYVHLMIGGAYHQCKVLMNKHSQDHSIMRVTYEKAKANSLQTARLPIQEYMVKKDNAKNFHSEILAINQVFDILCSYCETRSWPEALKAGVSPGKGFVLRDEIIPEHPLSSSFTTNSETLIF